MDDADQILVTDLKSLGVDVDTLHGMDSNKFVLSIGVVLANISKALGKDDFMDREKLRMAMNFDQVSNKFQVCQALVNYLKKLGFYYDINFNQFFYPHINNIRKILGFLFEYISKKEEEAQIAAGGEEGDLGGYRDEKDSFNLSIKRRLDKWTKKPWIMPEFYLETKNTFVRNRRKIRVFEQRDNDLIANTKNKKVLGVHEFLLQVKAMTDQMNVKNENINALKISDSAFYKAFEYENKQDRGILDEEESAVEVKRREYQAERAAAFENLKSLIPTKVRNINELTREKKATEKLDLSSLIPSSDHEYNLFNRNVKFEQDNDFAQKMIQRMREARKNAPKDPGSKEEFVSEEVDKMRRKNEAELREFEEEINRIKAKKESINKKVRELEGELLRFLS